MQMNMSLYTTKDSTDSRLYGEIVDMIKNIVCLKLSKIGPSLLSSLIFSLPATF